MYRYIPNLDITAQYNRVNKLKKTYYELVCHLFLRS